MKVRCNCCGKEAYEENPEDKWNRVHHQLDVFLVDISVKLLIQYVMIVN